MRLDAFIIHVIFGFSVTENQIFVCREWACCLNYFLAKVKPFLKPV
uniref:Uncharacterized protein n=1 Tax=Anguilla anguilla TaxID=7936 RepID=A0A0E9VG93_ANGAN